VGVFLLVLGALGIIGRNTPQRRLIAMTPEWVWHYVLPWFDANAAAVYARIAGTPFSQTEPSPVEQLLLTRYVVMQLEQGADANRAELVWEDSGRNALSFLNGNPLASSANDGDADRSFGMAGQIGASYVAFETERLLAHPDADVRGRALLLLLRHRRRSEAIADLLNRQLLSGMSRGIEQDCLSVALDMPEFRERLRPGLIAVLRRGQYIYQHRVSNFVRPDLDAATILLPGPDVGRLLLAYDQIFALGPRAAPLLPLVISHIGHPEYAVRMAALECIVAIAPAPTENIIAPLLNAATADDSPVRIRAGDALAAIAPGDHRTIAALAAALSDPRPAVRNSAAYHLGEIGPPALATVPALEVLRDDPDTQVAKTAALALVRIRR
jgi:hypothetical protein